MHRSDGFWLKKKKTNPNPNPATSDFLESAP